MTLIQILKFLMKRLLWHFLEVFVGLMVYIVPNVIHIILIIVVHAEVAVELVGSHDDGLVL